MNAVEKKRIVVKVGTSTLTHKTGKTNIARMAKLASVLADLHNMGNEVVLVSSGAIGIGYTKLGLKKRPETIKGIRLCRQNRGFWREEFYRHEDPRGREYFWLTGAFVNAEPEATDTDEWALANKYVAVVPVQVDLTDYRQLKNLGNVLK